MAVVHLAPVTRLSVVIAISATFFVAEISGMFCLVLCSFGGLVGLETEGGLDE